MSTRTISSKRLFVQTDTQFDLPPGTIIMWGGPFVPVGWTACYGQAVKRADYQKLFDAIGTSFGVGDGSTTFNLPDCRGRSFLGKDDLGGTSANRVVNAQADIIGGSAGAESHTLSVGELPSHTHNLRGSAAVSDGASTRLDDDAAGNASESIGGGGSHNNMSPYLTTAYIIKS